MGIVRILLLALLIFGLVRVLQYFIRRVTGPASQSETMEGPELLQCIKCGTWIPKENSIIQEGEPYCSEQCSDLPKE
ncbi:MAG: hypothetical protein HQL70_00910 [Magnetococcales bacterium]|nr:hypothetical protein [Magnetococcales bacterium]